MRAQAIWKGVGHIGGREARQRAELGRAVRTVWARNVHAVEEDCMQVRIGLQVGGRALHGHDCAALRELARAGAQVALVLAEH
jgi:hypothetical protein